MVNQVLFEALGVGGRSLSSRIVGTILSDTGDRASLQDRVP